MTRMTRASLERAGNTIAGRSASSYRNDDTAIAASFASIATRTTLRSVRAAGLLTTTTDYFASPTSKDARRAVRIACKVGAVPFVGNIALSKVPRRIERCPRQAHGSS